MAEIENEKTVIVDRDAADRRTPSGLVIALIVLAILALFFLLGGFNMFGGNAGTPSGTGTETDASTQIQEQTAPAPSTTTPTTGQ